MSATEPLDDRTAGADLEDELDHGPVDVEPAPFPSLGEGAAPGPARDLRLLSDVEVELTVELGRSHLPLRDLLAVTPGSVVELERQAESPVDVLVNGRLVARGEVVVVDGDFGVRITEVVDRG